MRRPKLLVLFLGLISCLKVEAVEFPRIPSRESEIVDVRIHFATVARCSELFFVEWAESESDAFVLSPKLRSTTLRTSGMSPVHRYKGPRYLRLYENENADPLLEEPFVEVKLPSVQGTYLLVLTRGSSHGSRTAYFLNLKNVASSPKMLTVFNATTASLEGRIDSQKGEISIRSGLTQGIPINDRGTVGFLFNFRGDSKQYVYAQKFSKREDQHLILILVPPLIEGSRDLMGHWIKVDKRDLI